MWYFLESNINKKETNVELNGSYDKLTAYFFLILMMKNMLIT